MIVAAADSAAWFAAIFVAVILRNEFDVTSVEWMQTLLLAVIAVEMQLIIGYFLGIYRGRLRYGSFDEVRVLVLGVVAETALLTAFVMTIGRTANIPRSTMVIALPIAIVVMCGVRYSTRLVYERRRRPARTAEKALVVGAGQMGEALLRAATVDPMSPLRFVGLLDDDPTKRKLRLRGVPVLGATNRIAEAVERTGATVVVIAIGSADAALLRRLTENAEKVGLRVYLTPPVVSLISGEQSVTDLRDISVEDLMGRNPVDTEVEQIAGYVTGRRVLVTGAGGSIGSELCRQLAKYNPAELIMVDRDETGLQMAQLGTAGHGLLDTRDVVLADIRDAGVIAEIFADRRPEVVFHAAALKHLPMLEQYPEEAWKTNVLGTQNVLEAAIAIDVRTFVNISTDKAANPTSVLGHSKRVAEKLTAWAASTTERRYLSVRFGNVIGSRGSMLPTFRSLIEAGGPVTVTHPDVTRYFMTIPEACQLVVQAGGIGRPGEVLILDMGEPVKILDVAKRMIAMSGKQVDIVYTGLREGEKLHEELIGDLERLERPFHPKISHTRAEPIAPERLDMQEWRERMTVERPLAHTVPGPRTSETLAVSLDGASL